MSAPRPSLLAAARAWAARRNPPRWVWVTALVVVIVGWGLLDVRLRGLPWPDRPLEHKTDLTVYTEAGMAFFDGRPPYEVTNPRGWKYVYPPLFAMLLAPLWYLPGADQVTIWFFVSVVVCWGCYREGARIVRWLVRHDERLSAVAADWTTRLGVPAVAAALVPSLNCLQRGQVGVLKLYLLLWGVRLVLEGRTWRGWSAGGVVLAAAITLKVLPVLPVFLLLLMQLVAALRAARGGRAVRLPQARRLAFTAAGVTGGLALFFLLVPASLVGWNANLRHLRSWTQRLLPNASDFGTDQFAGNSRTFRNQSLNNALYRMGNWSLYLAGRGPNDRLADEPEMPPMPMDVPVFGQLMLPVQIALMALLVLGAVRLARGGDLLGQAAGFGLGCVAMLVLPPIARAHYFMLLVPGVLFVPLWLLREGMPRAARAMAAAPAVLVIAFYLAAPQLGRIGLLGLGTAAWLIAAVLLVDRAADRAAQGAAGGDRGQLPFATTARQGTPSRSAAA